MPRSIEKLRDLDTAELEARERELAEQVFRLRFQLTTGQAEAVTRLRSARRDVARVKTLLRRAGIEDDSWKLKRQKRRPRPCTIARSWSAW